MEPCGLGIEVNGECDGQCYTKKQERIKFEDVHSEELEVILWRASLRNNYPENQTICSHHMYKFTTKFEKQFKNCCNPYGTHTKKKVKGKY